MLAKKKTPLWPKPKPKVSKVSKAQKGALVGLGVGSAIFAVFRKRPLK